MVDESKKTIGSGVVMYVTVEDGKATTAIGSTTDIVATVSAIPLVQKAVEVLGVKGGGGRPDMAQGGGPDGAKAADAIAAVKAALAG